MATAKMVRPLWHAIRNRPLGTTILLYRINPLLTSGHRRRGRERRRGIFFINCIKKRKGQTTDLSVPAFYITEVFLFDQSQNDEGRNQWRRQRVSVPCGTPFGTVPLAPIGSKSKRNRQRICLSLLLHK